MVFAAGYAVVWSKTSEAVRKDYVTDNAWVVIKNYTLADNAGNANIRTITVCTIVHQITARNTLIGVRINSIGIINTAGADSIRVTRQTSR